MNFSSMVKQKGECMKTKGELEKWAEKQMADGIPRQIICDKLLAMFDSGLDVDEMEAVLNVESSLSEIMLQRNLRGTAFEKEGQTDKAIEEYEANLRDGFSGSHPYERLRVIYAREKRKSEVIRVCVQYISILENLIKQGSKRSDLLPKLEKFLGYLKKYSSG